jgi:hypothetical protein
MALALALVPSMPLIHRIEQVCFRKRDSFLAGT